MSTNVVLTPNAPAMLNSMRALGYSFNTAVADVIDNSISAGASMVDVSLEQDESGDCFLAILDDGSGMDKDHLREAMRYACRSSDEDRACADLGRFGLGMKTASLSQCRRLTVLSKVKGGEINGVCWDIDRIIETNEWTLEILSSEECAKNPCGLVLQNFDSGTVVHWSSFDLLQDREKNIYESLRDKVDSLKDHLALIYHRFIIGEVGHGKLRLSVGNVPLLAKDPFGERLERSSRSHVTRMDIPGFPDSQVVVCGFTLPHQNKLQPSEIESLGLKGRSLDDDQGFYIYRAGRLVEWGKWFGLARRAQLSKLSRIRVDVPNALDHLWELDIKKSRATPPKVVRDRLDTMIEALTRKSGQITGGMGVTDSHTARNPEAGRPWMLTSKGGNEYRIAVNRESILYKQLVADMGSEARNRLEAFLCILERSLPITEINRNFVKDRYDPDSTEENQNGLLEAMREFLGTVGKEESKVVLTTLGQRTRSKLSSDPFDNVLNQLIK